jgi:S1-C subfamily serine protease
MLCPLLLAAQLTPGVVDYANLTRDERESMRWTPVVGVVQEVAPAVVFIQSERPYRSLGLRGPRVGTGVTTGSGVVIEESGYIVTNFHVVGNDGQITVQFDPELDSATYAAQLVSYSEPDDLALIKIDAPRSLAVVRRGTSADLWIGENVIAIGNPLQQKISVSTGIISGLHRNLSIGTDTGTSLRFPDLIQTDAAINRGNSGGPLLNILGELVGINTAINPGAENMGFAIPVDRVEQVLQQHLLAPSSSRSWLGFELDEADFCVTRVVAGGPAAAAGLEPGDRVLAINDEPLERPDDYRLPVLQLRPEQSLRLRVDTTGGPRTLEIQGWERVDGILWERLGMTVEALAIGREPWVRVARLDAGGPAAELGLAVGDVIDAVQVGRGQAYRVARPDALAALVRERPSGTEVAIDILRDDDGDGSLSRAEFYKGVLTLR